MPYIAPDDREKFDECIEHISDSILTCGDINYVVSSIISKYLESVNIAEGKVSYFHINQMIGVLECAKLELYRRIAVPYEDIKITENGDIYNG